jgi:hypothetical protein
VDSVEQADSLLCLVRLQGRPSAVLAAVLFQQLQPLNWPPAVFPNTLAFRNRRLDIGSERLNAIKVTSAGSRLHRDRRAQFPL